MNCFYMYFSSKKKNQKAWEAGLQPGQAGLKAGRRPEAGGLVAGPGWALGRAPSRASRPLGRPRPGHGRSSTRAWPVKATTGAVTTRGPTVSARGRGEGEHARERGGAAFHAARRKGAGGGATDLSGRWSMAGGGPVRRPVMVDDADTVESEREGAKWTGRSACSPGT